ncbi:MAG: hypothetical protein KC545_11885, partial [Nitrospira sp.]|nr:hypothetical protein [Nitrospira sp.]
PGKFLDHGSFVPLSIAGGDAVIFVMTTGNWQDPEFFLRRVLPFPDPTIIRDQWKCIPQHTA